MSRTSLAVGRPRSETACRWGAVDHRRRQSCVRSSGRSDRDGRSLVRPRAVRARQAARRAICVLGAVAVGVPLVVAAGARPAAAAPQGRGSASGVPASVRGPWVALGPNRGSAAGSWDPGGDPGPLRPLWTRSGPALGARIGPEGMPTGAATWPDARPVAGSRLGAGDIGGAAAGAGPEAAGSSTPTRQGYLLLTAGGGVSNFAAPWYGSLAGKLPTGTQAVAVAADPSDTGGSSPGGYWILSSNGGLYNFDAPWYGSPKASGGLGDNPVVGLAGDGSGYDVLRANGGVDNYGTPFHGSLANKLPAGVRAVAIAADPASGGYWILSSNGGLYNFDAPWYGSPKASGGLGDNPVVGLAGDGSGYDVLRANGGVDNYGTPFHGSLANKLPAGVRPVGIAADPATGGYWIASSAGNVFNFDAPFAGSLAGARLASPIVAISEDTTPVPFAVATSSLPTGTEDLAYQTTLAATGATSAVTWSLVSGSLPAGLALAPDGAITGTPAAGPGRSTFTVRAADSTQSATASLALWIYAPSSNWSGFVEATSTSTPSFTGVTATFDVPRLLASPAGSAMAEWVGIDGAGNSSLIQAGIDEQPVASDPGSYTITPWWEILPASETPITSLTVGPGDLLTVEIEHVSGTTWSIALLDHTTGKSFQIDRTYSGPQTSAEWIVEAPTVCTQSRGCQVAPLAPYTTTTFDDPRYSGTANVFEGISMVQTGTQVSTPSVPVSAGFRVAYGAATPPAP